MLWGLLAGVLAAGLFGLAAVVQARAVRDLDGRADSLRWFVTRAWRNPWLLGVVAAYLGGFVLHAVAIWLVPLYLAQATISLSLPITALTAAHTLHEPLGRVGWSGVAGVAAGLLLLAAGSGAAGPVHTSGAFVLLLWAGVAVLAVAGLKGTGLGGSLLGSLAGFGYAGSAVAVRAVGLPVDWLVVAAALAVPAYGVLAFWVYSRGLDRGEVAAATAPMIVGQTFIPAVLGVLLLGDGVRPGWEAAVLGGLLLATGGAIVLSREQAARD